MDIYSVLFLLNMGFVIGIFFSMIGMFLFCYKGHLNERTKQCAPVIPSGKAGT